MKELRPRSLYRAGSFRRGIRRCGPISSSLCTFAASIRKRDRFVLEIGAWKGNDKLAGTARSVKFDSGFRALSAAFAPSHYVKRRFFFQADRAKGRCAGAKDPYWDPPTRSGLWGSRVWVQGRCYRILTCPQFLPNREVGEATLTQYSLRYKLHQEWTLRAAGAFYGSSSCVTELRDGYLESCRGLPA